jgi:outer membrane protein, heavy metal efflux system
MMRYLFLVLMSLLSVDSFSEKLLTLKEAEVELQKNNLLILAHQYNITASQAAVIQAKVWEQPYLTAELNALNPQANKIFDVGGQGQKVLAVQQLIYLGGKKKNEVDFSKNNVELEQLAFEQLLRNLKFQLSQTFYNVYFDNQKILSIDAQISIIDTLVIHYTIQADKGNIPLREVVRLQSLALNLKNEKNNLLKDIIEAQQNLSLLTGVTELIQPTVNETELMLKYQNRFITKDSVLSSALVGNLDYLTTVKEAERQASFLKWQKSLATPDITTGLSYDQRGGAFQNQVNLTLGIPLPLWNKNKGNIQIAEAQLQQSNIQKSYQKLALEVQVESLWTLWQQQLFQYRSIDENTVKNIETVYIGIVSNFQKRNITMLEFTDFMESYKQSSIQINEIKKSFILSALNLNYITNKEIF